jgi:gamma-glutamylcyclotransferase (GGCT)/AIG2-like uncharacterized protein YtfP
MKDDYLFVYGTLRRNTNSEMYQLLSQFADFVEEATLQGRLYMVDHYPGIVISKNPHDIVRGEVYRLRESATVLAQLDEYEECGAGFPEPTEYIRRKESVALQRGDKIEAWVYIYNRPTDGLHRIESGDFLGMQKNRLPNSMQSLKK